MTGRLGSPRSLLKLHCILKYQRRDNSLLVEETKQSLAVEKPALYFQPRRSLLVSKLADFKSFLRATLLLVRISSYVQGKKYNSQHLVKFTQLDRTFYLRSTLLYNRNDRS